MSGSHSFERRKTCPRDGTRLLNIWSMVGAPKDDIPYRLCSSTRHIYRLDGTLHREWTEEELNVERLIEG